MFKQLSRMYSTSPAVANAVGGLATSQIRDLVGNPAKSGKPVVKMPPYLKPSQLRPSRGAYSDEFVRENYIKAADPEDPYNYRSRAFTYAAKIPMWAGLLAGTRVTVVYLMSQFMPSKSSLALANIEVDIGDIPEGKTVTIMWQGKPVFLRKRTDAEIEDMRAVPMDALKDPQTDEERLGEGRWAVFMAVCTHLGCVPVIDQGSYNAYFCPCHGSHYDHSGRIRKGPAPLNLEVPPFKLLDDSTLFIGNADAA
uniref:UQCRFS1 n=1 Tax=Euglena gracilis TaxID=3039 RepID=UPI002FE4FAD0|eukprot:EG_transcript_23844